MFNKLLNTVTSIRTALIYSRSRYSGPLSDLPDGLYAYWRSSAAREFRGIPRDAFFYARAAEGLMEFFDSVRRSPRPCGLPSKAADSVWHAWARFAPGRLERFCVRHFGRTIDHIEGSHMSEPMEHALANTLVRARAIESLPLAGNHVPRLFSLDSRLRMPKGYAWFALDTRIAYRSMDWQGRAEGGMIIPAALTPERLLAAGLVTQDEYDACSKPQWSIDLGGVDCSTAGDGGGDGGGCGGGCGGD